MRHKLIGVIFVVLLLLAAIPFPFTANMGNLLFGWLPVPLAYWWTLMFANLIFILWVSYSFVKSSEKENNYHNEKQQDSQNKIIKEEL